MNRESLRRGDCIPLSNTNDHENKNEKSESNKEAQRKHTRRQIRKSRIHLLQVKSGGIFQMPYCFKKRLGVLQQGASDEQGDVALLDK
jgi:hypothetical protein